MMFRIGCFIFSACLIAFTPIGLHPNDSAYAQEFDVLGFDDTAPGPWSDVARTSLTVPMVPFKSIEIDGKPSQDEYGGFAGVNVNPGENAWIYSWPNDREWDGVEDSSFTFWLAHDDAYLYLGVDVLDDVVHSDDPNGAFWQDDAIEIVTDVWNDNYDNNTDISNDRFGGHAYVNYEGRFSSWDEETQSVADQKWSSGVEWTYGPDGDVYGFGEQTETGWNMEVRFKKELFEDPEAGIKLEEGTAIGFNIGLDDDDNQGESTRTQDLELQYFWANRERFIGWDEDTDDGFWTQSEIDRAFTQLDEGEVSPSNAITSAWGINGTGRLSHGAAGEIVLGGLLEVAEPVEPPVVDPPVEPPVDPPVVDPPVEPPVDPPVVDPPVEPPVDRPVVDPPVEPPVDPPVVDPPVEPPVDPPVVDPPVTPEPIVCDPTVRGDVDGNGQPEFGDFLIISTNFGSAVANHTEGDINCSGTVDFGDFLQFSTHFGIATGTWDGDPIPDEEPSGPPTDPPVVDPPVDPPTEPPVVEPPVEPPVDPPVVDPPVEPPVVVDPPVDPPTAPPTEPVACDPTRRGDVDGNGQPEFGDFLIISTNFGLEVDNHTQGDVDCSGIVDFGDFLQFSTHFGIATGVWDGDPIPGEDGAGVEGTVPPTEPDPPIISEPEVVTCDPTSGGDIDGNGRLEFADFLVVSTNFGAEVDGHAAGDVDCNGIVEFADFLEFSINFGLATGSWDGDPIAVPEPNSGLLGIFAVASLCMIRRRRCAPTFGCHQTR